MKFFTKFRFLFLFFTLFFLGKGIEVKAQAYNEPVIFTRDPNAADAHWFRFVMNGYFMRADRDNGNRVIADSKVYDYGDDQMWCLVYQSPTYPVDQAGAQVKLYNKGTRLYAYVGSDRNVYLNNTGDVFTVSDANFVNFEFFLSVGNRRLNSYGPSGPNAFRVYRHPYAYGPARPNMKGAAIMQQGVPLSSDEMADIIPYLNSEGKAGGLTAEQLSGLKTVLQNANDKITVQSDGMGLNIYKPIGAYDAIRDELRKLQNNVAGHTSTLPDGFYRIKNASRQFYNLTQVKADNPDYAGLNPVLYANGTDVKWRLSTNSEDEIWQVKNNGNGTYTLTHMLTGNKYVTAGAPNVEDANELTAGAASGNIITMNPAKYPGHFALQFGGTVAHAFGHNNGSGTSGDVVPYQWGGEDALHSFATTRNDSYSEPSGWLFEPVDVPRLTAQEEANMKALLNAKNVVDGFTAAQLANLENLEDQYKQGKSSAELLSSLRAEISRLINLPYTDRIQWKNGFYAIKNGHINLYERETNELMLFSTKPFEATGEYERPGVEVLDWNRRPTTEQGANAEEVWYVEKLANGKMVFTNMKTLARIESFTGDNSNVSMLTGKGSEVTTSQPDQRNRPGQFKLTAADGSVAHPYGHNNGVVNGTNGTQGNIGSYDNNDLFSAWMLRQLDPANVSDPQGANHKITSVPAEAGKVKGYYLASEGVEGGYTTDELKKLSDAGNDPYDVTRAIAEIRSNGARIGSVEGLLRIYSAASDVRTKPGYGHIHVSYTANGTTVNNAPAWSYNDMTRADEIWEVKSTGSGTQPQERTLMSVNTGKYMSSVTGPMSDDANARKALIKAIDPFLYPGLFEIVLNHEGAAQNVHPGGHGNGATAQGSLANWRRGRPQDEHHLSWATGRYATDFIDEFSTFYFKKATEIHVKHNANTKWVTFNYPFAVSLREATAGRDAAEGIWLVGERNYSKTGSDAMLRPDHVKVSPIVGVQHIAANTPVILEYSSAKATDDNLFKLDIKYGADANGLSLTSQTTANNVWQGNTAPVVLANSEWVMVNTATFKGFRKAATNLLMPANKVFISGNSLPAAAKSLVFVWDLEDNATTGIHQVENNGTEKEVIYYDLSGRRVSNPTKGVYVTSEGKKVVLQ